MKLNYLAAVAAASMVTMVGTAAFSNNQVAFFSDTTDSIIAGNPCAAEKKEANPCAGNPCAGANPCAAGNPCAGEKKSENPCAGANPCAAENPCAGANPCAGK